MATPASEDRIQEAHDALRRRDWPRAYELLAGEDRATLSPEDLEGLAKAAWWTGRPEESIELHERAYGLYLARGDRARAAFVALTLRREHISKLASSVANGWLQRAERLLEGEPPSPAHGYLELARGAEPWGRGDLETALDHMERAARIAEEFDDPNLRAFAAMYRGMVLIALGTVEEGLALIDEVSAAAVGGELGAYTTGAVFCNAIGVSRDLADYRRAIEWSEAAKRWCERHAMTGFPGICRVHRAEVMRVVGAWEEAERELRRACDELFSFSPIHAGAAFHELGEVRLRTGDLAGAEEAFARANELGEDPQPGLALLLLARGDAAAAAASIRRSLEGTWDHLARARLLPVEVEAARIRGDPAAARAAAQELAEIGERFGSTAIRAAAEAAAGAVALLEGSPGDAVRRLGRARQLWREVDAPYEAARAEALLAEACLAEGDQAGAAFALRSARATFERLGAVPDARRAADLLSRLEPGAAPAIGAPTTRTFLFTDIVGSTALVEAIGDEAWEDLRRWHDETLRRAFAEHGGEEVDHAGDGFFVAFGDPASAVACAVAIQRTLAEHRRTQGFSPQVRIGLHAASARTEGGRYLGRGVHEAARIGAAAQGGEILASEATLEGLGDIAVSEVRELRLKGLARPVRVASVDWRPPPPSAGPPVGPGSP
ncbi:MAG TPA: adenylate/guanylate cyclase domain-containing protein [Actinomycetota bacterium]|nr:adenylate/guanylate cyclase domain-containing protein [Actinomycetota bacterium]